MNQNIKIAIILIIMGLIVSCKITRFSNKNFSYQEEVRDSILISTLTSIEGKFIYCEFDSIQLKGTKKDYDIEIESTINSLSEGLYKNTYQEMHRIVSNEFAKSDSVNLNTIKTTNLIETTNLIKDPIFGLVKSGKLFVYDKRTKQAQDSIWEKNYYRENLYQNSNRAMFYEGKLYTTRTGKVFLQVVLKSSALN